MSAWPEVDELLVAADRFMTPLHMGEGISETALEGLRKALRDCTDAWRQLDAIPKPAVNLFVDMCDAIISDSFLYKDEKYAQAIRYIADDLAGLVRESVALEVT